MGKDIELISLNDLIPPSISRDKNIQAIIGATDPQLQEVSQSIREAFIISRINELPENVIDLLAWQWHVDFYEPDLDIATKRGLVLDSIRWHRKKGTKSAVTGALERLGFVPTIKEWYEIGTVPHTFVVTGHYRDDDMNLEFLGENTEEILTRIVEGTKPARSKLLNLIVAPIPIDMKEHLCRWDFCEWEHDRITRYNWGMLNTPIEERILCGSEFTYGFYNVSDFSAWDFDTWGSTPYRLINGGTQSTIAILASLETDELTSGTPLFWDVNTWDSVRKVLIDSGISFGYGFPLKVDFEDVLTGSEFTWSFYCDLQPYWDMRSWVEHCTWSDDVEQHDFSSVGISPIEARLAWGDNVPVPTWSEYKTWEGSDTWSTTTEEPGACYSKTFLEV